MKKWVILQGKIVVALIWGFIIIALSVGYLYKEKKKNYQELHKTVSGHEQRIKTLEEK